MEKKTLTYVAVGAVVLAGLGELAARAFDYDLGQLQSLRPPAVMENASVSKRYDNMPDTTPENEAAAVKKFNGVEVLRSAYEAERSGVGEYRHDRN